jgi:hypothetical protein
MRVTWPGPQPASWCAGFLQLFTQPLLADLLRRNIAFLDHCLTLGTFTYAELEAFA